MNERGLSSVVATILIILLVLGAIAGIWVVINSFILKGSGSIGFGSMAVDMVIESAKINYSKKTADVTVVRNVGISDVKIKSLKFIVEDSRNSEIFEVPVENFKELTKRTFILDLNKSKILNINDIQKISVASTYLSESGTGTISSSLTSSFKINPLNSTIQNPPSKQCSVNLDCGTNTWIPNSKICSASNPQLILQYKDVYECTAGFCNKKIQVYPKESCLSSETCYAGVCQSQNIPCISQNVTSACGTSKYIGYPSCNSNPPPEQIVQDYELFECVSNSCQEKIISKSLQNCSSSQICGAPQNSPECFIPVECTVNSDCPLGKVCTSGNCTIEKVVSNGTISSIWPPNLGEYFNSPDLPNNKNNNTLNYKNYYIFFPKSFEIRCLQIKEFVFPNSTNDYSYIKLNVPKTRIASSNEFQIWQTSYGCTFNVR